VATLELEETGSAMLTCHTDHEGNINGPWLERNISRRGRQWRHHGRRGTQTGSWEIRTGSGNVHVRLPGNSAFEADLSTSSGHARY